MHPMPLNNVRKNWQEVITVNKPMENAPCHLLDDDYFNKAMASLFPNPENPKIAVGVSGGGDSMALLYLAQRWAKQHGGQAIALIVDHGLRAESKKEAHSVAQQLTDYGIENHILTWEGEKPLSNIQENAREERYALLTSWCKNNHISDLLIAHHADDQAETLLLRLLRGSGVDGLAAMASETKKNGIRILRPLLHIQKATLITLLRTVKWTWIDDPSNKNEKFDRVRVRNWIESQTDNARITERLVDTTAHLSRARRALETFTADAIKRHTALYKEGYATLQLNGLRKQPEEIGLRMLSGLLRAISGNPDIMRFESLQSLYTHLISDIPFKGTTLHGCQIMPKNNDMLLIIREYAAIHEKTDIAANAPILWDQRFNITVNTSLKATLYIAPIGHDNWHKICKENPTVKDNLHVKKMPKKALYTLPTLFTLEKILAIPHIGYKENSEELAIFCIFQPPETVSDVYFRYNNTE